MYGVSIGDIVGSPYEFSRKPEEGFDLFDSSCQFRFTDDTIETAAVCHAIMQTKDLTNAGELQSNVRRYLQQFGLEYRFCGFGSLFIQWIEEFSFLPYYSYGNGGAMRISPVAWAGKTMEEVFTLSDLCAGVTHNHPEGLKGARAIALAVFLARHSKKKDIRKDMEIIRQSIQQRFYILDFTIDEIKDDYCPSITCEGTVPQAIEAFLESDSFESAIRNAIIIGGDTDTIGAMTGAIAEAYYGVPAELKKKAITYLDHRIIEIFDEFEARYQQSP